MTTLDLTADRTDIILAQDNDKIISLGPFKQSGLIISRASKRLRFVIKPTAGTADASATLDKDSVTHPTIVYGVGTDAAGTWAVNLKDILPVVGVYYYRIDLTAVASLATDREIVAKGSFTVKEA